MKKTILFFAACLLLLVCSSCKALCQHDWALEFSSRPTCTTGGRDEFLCTKCGATRETAIAPTGHKPQNKEYKTISDPTCTKSGSRSNVCSVCGMEYTEAITPLGHNYVDGKCTRCGVKRDSGVRLDDAEAFTVAEAMVKQELKAPSTAKFCTISQASITHDGDVYTVSGWVDAQNSFGATLRSNWTVTFTAVKSGSKIGGEHGKVTID